MSKSFILAPIDFSHATSPDNSNFSSRTHRLAKYYITSQTDDRQTKHYSVSATISTMG